MKIDWGVKKQESSLTPVLMVLRSDLGSRFNLM